jgi:hypothetical protein
MRRLPRFVTVWRLALIGLFAGASLLEPGMARDAEPQGMNEADDTEYAAFEPAAPLLVQIPAASTTPRYYYGWGYQGFGYYVIPTQPVAPAAVAAPRPAASPRSSVGPSVRNWSTGRSSPLHRPWMKPM